MADTTRKEDWKDLDLNFGLNPTTGDVSQLKGIQAIGRALRNLVLMHFYDKPFNPQVGSSATKLLFEPMNPMTATHLQTLIGEVVTNWEPRASLISVNVKPDYDNNGYRAEIVYRAVNLLDPIQTTVFLERIR